jgi:protein-S-isoprenylcysteine O-methyltransferase Ste14
MESKNGADHPNIITWPPLIFAACAIGGTLLHFAYPIRVMRYSVSLSLGVVLAIVSAWVAIRAVRVMKAAGTNVRPDRPALKIVTSGPYRFTRNPMYLSLCLLQLALGFMLDGWVPVLFALLLALILHFGVILREESYLERKFGEEYLSFKHQVRRWL